MDRAQRRYKYKRPKGNEGKTRKKMQTRSCYISPEQQSFAELGIYENTNTLETLSQAQKLIKSIESTTPELITIVEPKSQFMPDIEPLTKPKRQFLPDMQTFTKSKRQYLPDMETLAKLKRPVLPDMITMTKPKRRLAPHISRPAQPSTAQPNVISKKSSLFNVNTGTEPYISKLSSQLNKHDVKRIEQYKSTLGNLTLSQLQELRKIFVSPYPKSEKASQYVNPSVFTRTTGFEDMPWPNVENAEDIENIICRRDEETLTQYHSLPKNLHIAEKPRIKLMAEKFSKYKKDNIELRRLEEKVVCVEYDVFDKEVDINTPVQIMRAFFSIKQPTDENEENELTELPETIKSKFNISKADLLKLNQKEVEIIDGKISENQPYLHDLRKLLRRKENSQKNKTTLNLQALYEMGKRDLLDFENDFNANVLPKEELVEMQNIILNNCKSSVYGIRRKTVKSNSNVLEHLTQNAMSRSLVDELLRESNKNVCQLYRDFYLHNIHEI